jgi:hypothetical protein
MLKIFMELYPSGIPIIAASTGNVVLGYEDKS